MPLSVRNNIDFKVDTWADQHGVDKASTAARKRRIQMLLPAIRDRNQGPQTLAVAGRMRG